MGDFDRVQQPGEKPKETKKVAMVLVLGAVLLGLVGFQMVKKGPEQAAAAPVNPEAAADPAADAAIDEPTGALREALTRDPAADFLRDSGSERYPTATLRNPFRMSAQLYDFVKPKEKLPDPQPVTQVVSDPVSKEPPKPLPVVPKGLPEGKYKLNTIVLSNGSLTALVNGVLVSPGSVIGEAVVVEIRDNGVTLRHKDFPNGPRTELKMN